MKVIRKMNDDIWEFFVEEGPAYFAYIGLGGSLLFDEVKTGDTWRLGYGEELVTIAKSEDEANEALNRLMDCYTKKT